MHLTPCRSPGHKSLTFITTLQNRALGGTFNCCQDVPQMPSPLVSVHSILPGDHHIPSYPGCPKSSLECPAYRALSMFNLRSAPVTFQTLPEFIHISPAVMLSLSKLSSGFQDDSYIPQTLPVCPLSSTIQLQVPLLTTNLPQMPMSLC